jgi:hypothetical protein
MKELVPRMRTLMPPPPGLPEFCVICAPATLPWSAWSTVTAAARVMAALSTLATLVPSARRDVGAAVPVTTTSFSVTAASRIVKSAVAVPPAATSTSCRAAVSPMRRATTVRRPAGTPAIA